MQSKTKYAVIYLCLIGLTVALAVDLAQAQESQSVSVEAVDEFDQTATIADSIESSEAKVLLNQAELDQMLAPIALYPDTVLSHVLVAATYPLELIQAARWREDNQDLTEDEVLDSIEDMDWDPSVKALTPFHDLLQQITDDLNWLQDLGDAFLVNEEQVLSSIQSLRQKAYAQGNLNNNEYIEVIEEDEDIIIEPVEREVVYIPYYDTRVVYGNWWWNDYPPRYWHRPAHYYWHAGLYWSPRIYLRHSIFFGAFHWSNRHIVVNHHYPRRYRYDDGVRRVVNHEYQRWHHNPHHRKGVRYSRHTPKSVYHRSRVNNKVVRSVEGQRLVKSTQNRPPQVRNSQRQVQKHDKVVRTKQRLNEQKYTKSSQPTVKRSQSQRNQVVTASRQQQGQRQVKTQQKSYRSNSSREDVVKREKQRQPTTKQNRQAVVQRRPEQRRTVQQSNRRSEQKVRSNRSHQRPSSQPRRSSTNVRSSQPKQKQR